MNAKNSLLVLAAVMLLVSQLFGEGSTIASVASSDDAELQQAMKNGEEAITRAALGDNKVRTTRKNDPAKTDATSLSEFYDIEEEVQEIAPEDAVSDEDPDADISEIEPAGPSAESAAPVQRSANAASAQPVGTYERPFEPFTSEE